VTDPTSSVQAACPACGSSFVVVVAPITTPQSEDGPAAPKPHEQTLTGLERQVLALVATGARDRDIAKACSVSVDAAKRAVRTLLVRFSAQNRTEAAVRAIAAGSLDLEALPVDARILLD